MSVTVSQKERRVIPAELRRKYNLHPGTGVQAVDYGDVFTLVLKLSGPAQQAGGMLKERNSLTGALLAQHRTERRVQPKVRVNSAQ